MKQSKASVIIIGGGVAGMGAANTLDKLGIGVHIIEKQDRLGGNAFSWACMATDECRHCGACLSAELVDQTGKMTNTTVHVNATVSHIEKKGHLFEAQLSGSSQDNISGNAVLLATGFSPFDPTRIAELGYGSYDSVITTADLNEVFKQEGLPKLLPLDNPSPSIAFVQCVGSRNRALGRDYCSQVCCKTALRQARKILHLMPEADITVFHMDLQIIGKAFRTEAAELMRRVTLRQGVPAKILKHLEAGKLSIIHETPGTGERAAAHFDLIVLAVGMESPSQVNDLADQLGIERDDWGFLNKPGNDAASGIYTAGTARGPQDILSAREQGIAVAHRIAMDLGIGAQLKNKQNAAKSIAVLGGTTEAFDLAGDLRSEGYNVSILDPETRQPPQEDGINYYPQVQLKALSGSLGRFDLSFSSAGVKEKAESAALVVALGAESVPSPELPDTCQSLVDFEKDFEADVAALPETTVFWLDRHGPEWKRHARRCLDLAVSLKFMDKTAIIIMEKMLVHGLTGQRLYDRARHAGVRFLRIADPADVSVTSAADGASLVLNEATLPGIRITINCQRLVVPDLMLPPVGASGIARIFNLALDGEGFLQSANVRHRPTGSPRRGIFFIGPCHGEVDSEDIEAEIQSLKTSLSLLLNNGQPGDEPAVIDEGLCARCLTCRRACPHDAVWLFDGYQPRIAAEACFGCGICVSSCPARAISFGESSSDEPRTSSISETVLFACERSAFLAAREAGLPIDGTDGNISVIPLPCASHLDQVALVRPLIEGAKRVIVAGCHEGNCRSIKGTGTALVRARQIAADIKAAEGTISHHSIAANEPRRLVNLLNGTGSSEEESHA